MDFDIAFITNKDIPCKICGKPAEAIIDNHEVCTTCLATDGLIGKGLKCKLFAQIFSIAVLCMISAMGIIVLQSYLYIIDATMLNWCLSTVMMLATGWMSLTTLDFLRRYIKIRDEMFVSVCAGPDVKLYAYLQKAKKDKIGLRLVYA